MKSRITIAIINSYFSMVVMAVSMIFLIGCSTTSYKFEKIDGQNSALIGCSVMRQSGSFSSYGSRIDSSISQENARGNFVNKGTQIAIEKVESSWDFENGYRARIYLKVPVGGYRKSFFIEKNFDEKVSTDMMSDFVHSYFLPC